MIVYGNNFGNAFKASTVGGGGTRKRDGEGFCAVFALSVSFGDSSPKGRAFKLNSRLSHRFCRIYVDI